MILPLPTQWDYKKIEVYIKDGKIKIPQFQRDFVWTIDNSAGLLDSIIKGYPLGTFILWKTKDELRHIREIGNNKFKKTPKGDFVQYVLDGQQRLTSIYASFSGSLVKRNKNKEDDFSKMYISLIAKKDEGIVITDIEGLSDNQYISLHDLMIYDILKIQKYSRTNQKILQEYRDIMVNYKYPIIEIESVPIEVATEIFTRINVTGKALSSFEIMVAKTYDDTTSFDLGEKRNQVVRDLARINFDSVSDSTILQIVAILLTGECRKSIIWGLKKDEFILIWDDAIAALKSSINFIRMVLKIPASDLLPYNGMLVPLSYYFYKERKRPTENMKKNIERWFWQTAISERY
jgi:uncharacterized protein with ParB-like and HNH nuclease domain